MTLISFFTSLINIGTEWYMSMLYAVCLFFEGAVFAGVKLIYNLFLIVCSINLSTAAGLMSSLIDRIKALIIVFIVFKLGVALIGYLMEPEKAQKEGTKIIVNIFITALLLISYSTIFDIFNELNLLILGNPTKYPYTVLSTIVDVTPENNDKGLIMRLVFGEKSEELDDVGEFLAYSTLTMFIHDYNNPTSSNNVSAVICPATSQNGCNFFKLVDVNPKIGLTVEYYPFFAFVIGLFLVYSIGKSAISVGVRMFKLVILQLLAPVAIITILDKGIKSDTFQKFFKKYIEVYLSAMLRLLATLIVTVFICKFIVNINDYVAVNDTGDTFTNILVSAIVIWAGFKFMSEAPAFIESVIGAKLGGDDKSSFGQFLGGVLGGTIGGAVGAIGGFATGAGAGHGLGRLTGGIGNMLAGGIGGVSAGAKGKNVADKFKNLQGNAQNYRNRAANMGMAGGGIAYGASKLGGFLGIPQGKIERGQRAADRQTAMDNMIKTLEDNYDEKIEIGGQNIGLTRDLFRTYAGNVEVDSAGNVVKDESKGYFSSLSSETQKAVRNTQKAYGAYKKAQGHYDELRMKTGPGAPSEADLAAAWEQVEGTRTAYQSLKSNSDKKIDTDFNTRMIKNAKDPKGKFIKAKGRKAVETSIQTYDNVATNGYLTDDFIAGTEHTVDGETVVASTKSASDLYTRQQDRTTHSRSATRFNNSNFRGGSGK